MSNPNPNWRQPSQRVRELTSCFTQGKTSCFDEAFNALADDLEQEEKEAGG